MQAMITFTNGASMVPSSLLLPIFLIVRLSLASDGFFPLSNEGEKVYRSVVSLQAIGADPMLVLNEKNSLEQSFKTSYEKLTQYPSCALRTLKDVSLVDIKETRADYNAEDSDNRHHFSLHFEMLLSCFDCPIGNNGKFLFNDPGETRNRRGLQNDDDDNSCYWSNYHLVESDATLNKNSAAPSRVLFLDEFNNIVLSNQKLSSIVREGLHIIEDTRMILSRSNDHKSLPCPCPPKSFCSYTDKWQKNFWKVPSSNLFYNCTCRDGFVGEDGWRCETMNECDNPDDWPCASPSEGGFCVNTHPDDMEHPMYKCGCQSPDFVADDRYPIDLHGVKHCLPTNPTPEAGTAEVKNDGITNIDQNQNATLSDGCLEVEKGISGFLFIDVNGNPETVFDDAVALEESIKAAYEEALGTPCAFRSLTDASLLGVILQSNEFVENENAEYTNAIRNRFLEDRQNKANGSTAISDSNTNTYNNALAGYLDDDDDTVYNDALTDYLNDDDDTTALYNDTLTDYLNDDDNDSLEVEFSFNFTLFFSLIMRCYGCSNDALLFNDASRRKLSPPSSSFLRIRQLRQQDSTCTCQIENELIEDSFIIAPTIDTFLQRFENITERQGDNITSIREITGAEEKTNDDSAVDIIRNSCLNDNKCDVTNQECVQGICICKAGYIAPSGRGGKCQDIEECKHGHNCDQHANCIELDGSYDCICKPGFDGDGFNFCSDINECVLNTHDCGKGNNIDLDVCINRIGSYDCVASTSLPTRKPTRIPTRMSTKKETYTPGVGQ